MDAREEKGRRWGGRRGSAIENAALWPAHQRAGWSGHRGVIVMLTERFRGVAVTARPSTTRGVVIAAEEMWMQVTLQKPGSRGRRKVGWELEGASEAKREVCLVGDDVCASMCRRGQDPEGDWWGDERGRKAGKSALGGGSRAKPKPQDRCS